MAPDPTKEEFIELSIPYGKQGTIKIILDKREHTAKLEEQFSVEGEELKGPLDDELLDDDNVPKIKKGRWEFFDLGTRLNVIPGPDPVASTYLTGIIPVDTASISDIADDSLLEYLEFDFDATGTFTDKL